MASVRGVPTSTTTRSLLWGAIAVHTQYGARSKFLDKNIYAYYDFDPD
jgi:hypothetical protein